MTVAADDSAASSTLSSKLSLWHAGIGGASLWLPAPPSARAFGESSPKVPAHRSTRAGTGRRSARFM